MKRIYQLGEPQTINAKGAVNLLNDKEDIINIYGEDDFNRIYKEICNDIREKFGFNYYISLGRLIPKENASKETIEFSKENITVVVFDFEITEDTEPFYEIQFDEEKDLWYIEIGE